MDNTTETKPKKITHFNKKAFQNCDLTLDSLNLESKGKYDRVKKEMNFFSFRDLICKTECIIDAIQIIALADVMPENDHRLSIISDLAELLKGLIPNEEMEFLDDLFIDTTNKASNLINIENL